ncbi:hypothetical protein JOS77_06305 [Chromobacterium haemolyticum]|nr:hypothetical protein JOS77_06305 [Chromobacterium haemolyticum]
MFTPSASKAAGASVLAAGCRLALQPEGAVLRAGLAGLVGVIGGDDLVQRPIRQRRQGLLLDAGAVARRQRLAQQAVGEAVQRDMVGLQIPPVPLRSQLQHRAKIERVPRRIARPRQ